MAWSVEHGILGSPLSEGSNLGDLNQPPGLAWKDSGGVEGAAVTFAPSPCEQGSNEDWGLGVLKGF